MYYRKYRSQTIAEIDNTEIRETLGKALLANKFSQAYLLIGTRGSGKTSMARLIAKVVNCTKRKQGDEPCNGCDSCKAITAGRSLDVIEIDAASNTGVDDIRELRERVKLAPVQGKFKVYIIDEVHMLSTSAFNALLKTLEEPPEHVIFVLATTDPQKLPETIVSRCLVYDFKTASREEILRSLGRVVLGEKIVVEDGVLERIADMAKGSFRDSQKILEQVAMKGGKINLSQLDKGNNGSASEMAREILLAVSQKEPKTVVLLVEKFCETDGKIETLVEAMMNTIRKHLLASKGVTEEKSDLAFSDSEVRQLVAGLVSVSQSLRDNPVPQLSLESFLLEVIGVEKAKVTELEKPRESKKKEELLVSESLGEVKPAGEAESPLTKEKQAVAKEASVGQGPNPTPISTTPEGRDSSFSIGAIQEKWPEILVDLKPYNHSLVAFLRACRPKEVIGDTLVIDVFYKFHRDKLSEQKNREIFEDVVSKMFGGKVRAKFDLSEKKSE